MNTLYQGDCLTEMSKVPDHTVNMIFTNLPYGTTKNAWDVPIPLDKLWGAVPARLEARRGGPLLFPDALRCRSDKQ